ncbi:hypothetical protein lerEdw1_001364 [Lerista edwardsae]|nr:hypothetical protein lerEdw1_001364 [Lerista edwardsae]
MVAAPPLRAVYSLTDTTPARTIWVYRNGDAYYVGRKFVVNHRYVPNFEAFMIQLNEGVETPFGVRNVYTPRQGHSVLDLADLQQGGRYVVAGRERFKKLNYFSIGAKKPQARKRDEVIRPVVHSNIQVPSKWQSFYNKPRNIHVFTNGDTLIKPMKILIPKYSLKNWNRVLGLINEKVKLRTGGIHRLYTLRGQLVHGSDDLEDNEYYVACGKEKFKALPYWNNSKVPENIQRCYCGSFVPQSKPPEKKKPHIEQFEQRRTEVGRGDMRGDMNSVYFAKSKKASPETAPTALSSDDGNTKYCICYFSGRSVYKAGRRRSETEGAKDIPEDQNMQVDIPVEQAPAEIVQDEDVYYNVGSTERKASTAFVQDEDIYSNVENVEEQAWERDQKVQQSKERPKLCYNPDMEQKRGSSLKKLFGFLFGSSKKKDESQNEERDEIMGGTDSPEEEDTAPRFVSENEPRNGHQQVNRVESIIELQPEKKGVQKTTGDSGS